MGPLSAMKTFGEGPIEVGLLVAAAVVKYDAGSGRPWYE